MEHRRKGRKLKRTASHRKALLSNLSIALIKYKRIETTVAKAKELRTYIEPLVTKAKKALTMKDSEPAKNVHLRRMAKKLLKSDEAVTILFNDIGPKVLERNGGYTRILKSGHREGDGGDTAIIEFVDFSYLDTKTPKKEKKGEKKGKAATENEDTEIVEDDSPTAKASTTDDTDENEAPDNKPDNKPVKKTTRKKTTRKKAKDSPDENA